MLNKIKILVLMILFSPTVHAEGDCDAIFEKIEILAQSLSELDADFVIQGGPETLFLCALEKNLKSDLQCVDPSIFSIDPSNKYLFQCLKNGETFNSAETFMIEGTIGIKIAKFLNLLSMTGSYSKTDNTTKLIYTCQNWYNGDIYTGTLEAVTKKYKAFLNNQ
jgi:hypothetical protein